MGVVIVVIGILTWIISAIAVGILAIVLTIKNGIINRQLAICLMLAFYGLPALVVLYYDPEITKEIKYDFFGIDFGIFLLVLFVQVLLCNVIGEIIFKVKIVRPTKGNE